MLLIWIQSAMFLSFSFQHFVTVAQKKNNFLQWNGDKLFNKIYFIRTFKKDCLRLIFQIVIEFEGTATQKPIGRGTTYLSIIYTEIFVVDAQKINH